jgi:hypothetical protein
MLWPDTLIQAEMTGLIFGLCFGLKRAVHYANPAPQRSDACDSAHLRARILDLQIRHLCLLSYGAYSGCGALKLLSENINHAFYWMAGGRLVAIRMTIGAIAGAAHGPRRIEIPIRLEHIHIPFLRRISSVRI